jgi:hypothetical protein
MMQFIDVTIAQATKLLYYASNASRMAITKAIVFLRCSQAGETVTAVTLTPSNSKDSALIIPEKLKKL